MAASVWVPASCEVFPISTRPVTLTASVWYVTSVTTAPNSVPLTRFPEPVRGLVPGLLSAVYLGVVCFVVRNRFRCPPSLIHHSSPLIVHRHITTLCEGVEVRHSFSVAVCSIPKSGLPCRAVWNTVAYGCLSDTIFEFDPFPFTTRRNWFTHHLKELVIICTMRRIAGANPPHPCRLYSVPSPNQSHVPLNKENALLDLMLTPWIESGGI